MSKKKKNSSRH